MGLPTVAMKRPIFTMMLYIALCIFGLISFFALEVELYQGINQSVISIVIRARGGLPATEVEKMITRPTEEAVATVTGIRTLYSNSREAESRVTMEFEPGTNMRFAALEIREKFARVKPLLPKEIEKPVGNQITKSVIQWLANLVKNTLQILINVIVGAGKIILTAIIKFLIG